MKIFLVASLIWGMLISVAYGKTGLNNIRECYAMWFKSTYWTNYNFVEALSWLTKAIIIVPGLIFNINIWWLYFLTLATSLTLIWSSNKKLLPTLVAFNTLWAWISCMVITKNIL